MEEKMVEKMVGAGEIIELKVIQNDFVEKPEKWVNHVRSKNYIAQLVGIDKKYGFERKFLEKTQIGRRTFFMKEDFVVGEAYEIKCIYYTRSGNPDRRVDGIFECISINDEKITLKKIDEDKALQIVKERHSEKVKAYEEEVISAKMVEEVKEAEKRIKEARELKEAMEEAKKELEKEAVTIDENEVKELKQRLKKEIEEIACRLLSVGNMERNVRRYKEENIEIKEERGKLLYVRVDNAYVISMYNNDVSLKTLVNSLRKLRESEKNVVELIKSI